MNVKDRKYIDFAAKLAEDVSPVANARVAAIIVFRNEIVGIGTCQYKTHPFQSKFRPNEQANFWHAETNAIYNALKRIRPDDLQKSTLYIARVKRSGWGLAKPCTGCQHAIDHFKIGKVFYTGDNNQIVKL